jgi:hypothetical protein
MILEYTEGHYNYSIDNKDYNDYSNDEIAEILKKLIDKYKNEDPALLQRLFEIILVYEGEMENLGQCDSCGEFIDNYKIEL